MSYEEHPPKSEREGSHVPSKITRTQREDEESIQSEMMPDLFQDIESVSSLSEASTTSDDSEEPNEIGPLPTAIIVDENVDHGKLREMCGIGDTGLSKDIMDRVESVNLRLHKETAVWRAAGIEEDSIQVQETSNPHPIKEYDDQGKMEIDNMSSTSFDACSIIESMDSQPSTDESEDNLKSEGKITNRGVKRYRQQRLPKAYQKKQREAKLKPSYCRKEIRRTMGGRVNGGPTQMTLGSLWGDGSVGEGSDKIGELVGDSITPKKDAFVCFLQNANSIKARLDDTSFGMMMMNMDECNIGVGMFPETNVNWRNTSITERTKKIVRKHLKSSKIVTSHCGLVADTNKSRQYLPGGTLTVAANSWTSRIVGSGQDKLGRWSWVTFAGKRSKKIQVITAYKVGKGNKGDLKFHSQLKSRHMAMGEISPDPWKRWTEDFEKFISKLQKGGSKIIIGLDANEALDKEPMRNSFMQMCRKLNLVDAFKWKHPDLTPMESVQGGSDRIDGFFCSEEILETIIGVSQMGRDRGLFSDHRPMVIEFDKDLLFGQPEGKQHKKRLLKTGNDVSLERYIDDLTAQSMNYKLQEKITNMERRLKNSGATASNRRLYDKIDKIMEDSMKSAEKKCAKRNDKKYNHSAALDEAGWEVRYWKGRSVNPKRRKAPSREQLEFYAKLGKVVTNFQENKEEVDKKRGEAWKRLHLVHKNHEEERNNHLFKKALERHGNDEKEAKEAILRMRHKEKETKQYGNIRATTKGTRKGLTYIMVQDNDTDTFSRVDDRHEMERLILEQNKKQLTQAKGTPFAHGKGREDIDIDNPNNKIRDILEGKYDPSWIDAQEGCKEWVQQLQSPFEERIKSDITQTIGKPISIEEFMLYWGGLPEKTVSSPSGLHVGHYKAIACSEFLSDLWVRMATLPAQYGFAPKRWKQSLHCMLAKDVGSPKLNRLRIVQLVEADLNFVLKRIWGYRLSREVEKTGELEDSQMGGRINRMAISTILRKILQYDSMRIGKQSGATLDNDAVGCFDRIIPSLASLTCMRLGLPQNAARMLYRVLNGMTHHLCTGYGVSLDFLNSIHTLPLFGTGQGSGASPFIWITTCEINLKVLRNKGFKVLFVSPNGQIQVHRPCDAFVDDTALTVVADSMRPREAEKEAVEKIRTNGQLYEKCLWTSGGALALHKCAWFLLVAEWIGTEMYWKPNKSKSPELQLTSGPCTELNTIRKVNPRESIRQLGVYVSPLGVMTKQVEVLEQKTSTWARQMRNSSLTPTEVYISFKTGIQMSVRYVVPVTRMSEVQCNRIDTHMITALLHAHNTTRTLPRAILHGSPYHGGLGINSTMMNQIVEGINLLVGHLRMNDTAGRLGEIVLQQTQLEVGTSTFFLEKDPSVWSVYCTPSLIQFWWINAWKCRINITGFKAWVPESMQREELSIMDLVVPHCSPRELKEINAVRLYLQIYYPSEIIELRGYRVLTKYQQMERDESRGSTNLLFPNQRKPSPLWKPSWDKAVSIIERENMSRDLVWKYEGNLFHWKWWVDRTRTRLYSITGDVREYKESGRVHKFTTSSCKVLPSKPPDLVRCDVRESGTILTLMIVGKLDLSSRLERVMDPLEKVLNRVPRVIRRIMGVVHGTPYIVQECLAAARNGQLYAAADGSVRQTGAHGWAVCAGNIERYINGMGPVDGPTTSMTSYRTELWGMLAVICAMEVFAEAYKGEGRGILYVDNRSAVDQTKEEGGCFSVRDATKDEVELIMEIRTRLKSGKIRWKIEWIRSHQEEQSSLGIKLNTLVDSMANIAHNLTGQWKARAMVDPLPNVGWNVQVNGSVVHGKMRDELSRFLQTSLSRQFIIAKEDWTMEQFDSINWESLRQSNKGRSFGVQLTRAKLGFEWLATNSYQHKRHYVASPKCPFCDEEENWDHVFRCMSTRASAFRRERLKLLRDNLQTLPTPGCIVKAMIRGLVIWTGGREEFHIQESMDEGLLKQAIRDQTSVGWKNIIKGRMVSSWMKAATEKKGGKILFGSPKDGQSWARKAVNLFLAYGVEIWKFRNSGIHGETRVEKHMSKRLKLVTKIKGLYRQRPKLRTTDDSRLFGVPLDTRLRSNNDYLEAWLCHVRVAQQSYAKYGELKEQGVGKKQMTITEWLKGHTSTGSAGTSG